MQVLTYDEWKGDHEPFDREKHMVQVVAVENILQAADVAVIDESEIQALETYFVPHAAAAAEALMKTIKIADPCFNIIYAKDIAELGLDQVSDPLQESCGSIFLVRPDLKSAIRKAYPDRVDEIQRWEFDATCGSLYLIFRKIDDALHGNLGTLAKFSLLAPYFFLVNQWDEIQTVDRELHDRNLTLFANNDAVQGLPYSSECCSTPVLVGLSGFDGLYQRQRPFPAREPDESAEDRLLTLLLAANID